jgi:hypothetical protein
MMPLARSVEFLYLPSTMTDTPINVEAIEKRLREVTSEIQKLEEEADKLEAALEVIRLYSASPAAVETTKLGPPRPANAPSLYRMVATILREAHEANGVAGMTSKSLVDGIGRRYWPGVQARQVMPTIYKFVKAGRIEKKGEYFMLPKNEAPAD